MRTERKMLILAATLVCFSTVSFEIEAKRVGGGKTTGATKPSSSSTTKKPDDDKKESGGGINISPRIQTGTSSSSPSKERPQQQGLRQARQPGRRQARQRVPPPATSWRRCRSGRRRALA